MSYLLIVLVFGLAGGLIGRRKGSSFVLWFFISALLPFVGLLTAIAYRPDGDEPLRDCPRCGKVTKISDAICMRCGTELDFPAGSLSRSPESE